jgi:hypothetical protein
MFGLSSTSYSSLSFCFSFCDLLRDSLRGLYQICSTCDSLRGLSQIVYTYDALRGLSQFVYTCDSMRGISQFF